MAMATQALPSMATLTAIGPLTLPHDVAAIEMVPEPTGRTRMGLCTYLAQGSAVEICGRGFSSRTVQVKYGESFYIVLLDRVLT